MAKEQAELKTWRVTDTLGNVEMVKAHFMFREETGGLTFRYKTDTQSYVPACYGAGQFVSCILLDPPAEPATAPTGAPPKQASVTPFQKRNHPQGRGRNAPLHRDLEPLDDEIPF